MAAAVILAGAMPASAGTSPTATTSRIGLFCPCWRDGPTTDAEWASAAKNHAVIAGHSRVISTRTRQLHQVNPAVVVIGYNLGPYLARGSSEYDYVMRNHPGYFARDARGMLITVPDFPNNTLMDQGNPGWRAYHAQAVAAMVASAGLDGAYVDSVGPAAVSGGYTSAVPINKSTGRAYTIPEWLNLSVLSLNAIKAKLGTRYVMFNGLKGGPDYAQTKILTSSNADAGMAEGFVRMARSSITAYPSAADVQSEIDMILDMESKGVHFFGWTKTWASSSTAAQREAWNQFALGVYLLGRGAHSYYNFLPTKDVNRAKIFYANQTADLGAPLAGYKLSGGVYTRVFQRGKVTVDPARKTAAITLT